MEIARRHGLKVKALMSIGHAGESAETIQATKDWLLDERPDDFDCTVITTYPGTPYYDEARETEPGIWTYTAKNGDRLHAIDVDFNETAEYYKGIPGEYHSYVYTDHLSAAELVRLRDDLENDVRAHLDIPFNAGSPGVRYEASMGLLPGYMLRQTGQAVGV
jgi:anaerobic magnesium-protoporphyrin IX monomethyl ester cyclase